MVSVFYKKVMPRRSGRHISSLAPSKASAARAAEAARKRRQSKRKFSTGGAMTRLKNPVPAQMYCKFHYQAGYINLSSTVVPVSHQFRINSLFDPDLTAVGGQPYFYDQLVGASGIYENYRVHGCKLRVKVKVRDASALESCDVVLYALRPGQAAPTTIEQAQELPRSKSILVSKNHWKQFSYYYDNSKVAGVSNVDYRTDDDTSAGSGANPVKTNLAVLMSQAFDRTTSTLLDVSIDMVFYATLFGLKTVARS